MINYGKPLISNLNLKNQVWLQSVQRNLCRESTSYLVSDSRCPDPHPENQKLGYSGRIIMTSVVVVVGAIVVIMIVVLKAISF